MTSTMDSAVSTLRQLIQLKIESSRLKHPCFAVRLLCGSAGDDAHLLRSYRLTKVQAFFGWDAKRWLTCVGFPD